MFSSPTPTTPTLTPTTLKNIAETFLMGGIFPAPLEHQHQAGFVPPKVQMTSFPTSITMCTTESDDSYNDSDDSQSQSFWSDSSSIDPKSRSSKSTRRKPRRNEHVNRLKDEVDLLDI